MSAVPDRRGLFGENDKPQKQIVEFSIYAKPVYVKTIFRDKDDKGQTHMTPIAVDRPSGYVDTIYVKITNSLNDVVHREAEPQHFEQFPTQWAKFQQSAAYKQYIAKDVDKDAVYTSLEQITQSPAMVRTLNLKGIRSVEELATTPNENIVSLKGAIRLKQMAIEHLSRSPGPKPQPSQPAA